MKNRMKLVYHTMEKDGVTEEYRCVLMGEGELWAG
jgi:hypothetical protein